MGKNITTGTKVTIGLDLSDKYAQICVIDETGEKVEESRVRMTREALSQRFSSCRTVRVAMEVGTHSPWVSRLLGGYGHEVIVANPRKLRLIYSNEKKDDRVDAEYLARLGRVDPKLLAPVQHRSQECQGDRELLKARDLAVRTRVQLVGHMRGVVKAIGVRLPACSTQSFVKKAAGSIPAGLLPALQPLVKIVEELTKQIREYDEQIKRLVKKYAEAKRLCQVNGVGSLTAVGFLLTLEEASRFRKSRVVGAFLGLVPRRQSSGEQSPQLRITKAGDSFLRRLLVGCAHYILGPFGRDSDLRRWGLKLAERGGKNSKKRAVVAVARKLAVLLHRLWVTGEEYDPLRNARRRGEIVETVRAAG